MVMSTVTVSQWTETNGPDIGPASRIQNIGAHEAALFAGTGMDWDPGIFDGAIHRTTDNGESWADVGGWWGGYILGFGFYDGAVFAATEVGVFRSTDNGNTWSSASNGLSGGWFYDFAVSGGILFVGGYGGISRSTNGGNTWTATSYSGNVDDFATQGTVIFANGQGVVRSTDAGSHWVPVNNGLPVPEVSALTINGTTVFAGVSTPDAGVYRSTNNGSTWTHASNGMTLHWIRDLITVRGVVFAAGDRGVFRSTNNGSTWIAVNEGLTDTATIALATNGTKLFASTARTTFRRPLSDLGVPANILVNPGFEQGTTPWQFYSNGSATFSTVAVPGASGTKSGRISINTQGTNVQLYQAGLVLEPRTTYRFSFRAYSNSGHNLSVYLHKHTPPYTAYGLSGKVFNITTAWQQFSVDFVTSGFTNPVTDGRLRFWLAPYDAAGDKFSIDDAVLQKLIIAKGNPAPETPASFALYQNYPNPFNPKTIIHYRQPTDNRVTLRVYDILGQEIATLVDEIQEAGYKSVEFDASGLSSGVYFYRLHAGEFNAVKKMIVTK